MMNLEQLIPLVVVYLIWRFFTQQRQPADESEPESALPPEQFFDFDQYPPADEPVSAPSRPRPTYHDPAAQDESVVVPPPSLPVAPEILPARPGTDRSSGCVGAASRRRLRQAVVWSEILQPPVGLRR